MAKRDVRGVEHAEQSLDGAEVAVVSTPSIPAPASRPSSCGLVSVRVRSASPVGGSDVLDEHAVGELGPVGVGRGR